MIDHQIAPDEAAFEIGGTLEKLSGTLDKYWRNYFYFWGLAKWLQF